MFHVFKAGQSFPVRFPNIPNAIAMSSAAEHPATPMPVTGNVYDNLEISHKVFLPSHLPLDAKISGDLALLARSRSIFLACTAMYLVDRFGGRPCQRTAETQQQLHQARTDIRRQVGVCICDTSRRQPSFHILGAIATKLLDEDLEQPASALRRGWQKTVYKTLLRDAEAELKMYDELVKEVEDRATEGEIKIWLDISEGQDWRGRHHSAMTMMNGWFEPATAPNVAQKALQDGIGSLRRGWSSLGK